MAERRILVVDDDDAIRTCVAALLREEGYEVLSAANGLEAIELLAAANWPDGASGDGPDLILLDLHMPALDGRGFTREYRLRPGPHAPILVMTAAPDAAQRAAEIEAHAVLAKPFDIDHVPETVRQCLAAPPHHGWA